MLLHAKKLSKRFGEEFLATNDITVSFEKGVLTSIIGPNGAGKTTLINLLSGSLKPDSGSIFLRDDEITDLSVAARIKKGLCRSFQITNIFPELSLIENIQIPLISMYGKTVRLLSWLNKDRQIFSEACSILEDIGLLCKKDQKAARLSHGEQRQLEVGIALATHPVIIFLDEPTQGMNKVEKMDIMANIVRFSREGRATFVIVEHDMDVVFSTSERIVVLHSGAVIADGAPQEIRKNSLVRKIYLGEEA